MVYILLLLIYLAFVSLGLPDGLSGVAWPLMYKEFSVAFSFSSIAFIPCSIGSVLSSLMIGKVLRKFKTGQIVMFSCILTGVALFLFSFATSIVHIMLIALPLGIGAGGVDAALNDYVARRFTAKHMNWLHASYGVGTTIGPVIMTTVIAVTGTWRWGDRIVGIIQLCLAALFFATLFVWKKAEDILDSKKANDNNVSVTQETLATSIDKESTKKEVKKPVKKIMRLVVSFGIYTGCEACIVSWAASYFNLGQHFSLTLAGELCSAYFAAFVVGRVLCGFIVEKLSMKGAIIVGTVISAFGLLTLMLAGSYLCFAIIGVCLIGIGYAPIYPCMMQQTPLLIEKEYVSDTIGYQMACANVAYFLFTYTVGLICEHTTLLAMPFLLFGLIISFALVKVVPELKMKKA